MYGRILTVLYDGDHVGTRELFEMAFRSLKAAGNDWEKVVEQYDFWRILVGRNLVRESGFLELLQRDGDIGIC